MAIKQTAGRKQLGSFAPKFAELNDDVLFGEVWSRDNKLSLRDRSIVTVSVFMGKGLVTDAFKHHIQSAKNHGVTLSEMVEIITHAAFYAGWPNAWAAFGLIKEVYADEIEKESKEAGTTHGGMFGMGEPNSYGKYFIGNSYLKPLTKPDDYLAISNVTFEPGCRNNWHVHHATKGGGQVLICVEGEGIYMQEGKELRYLKPGDIVEIPANTKHWHGATKDSWFSHLAFEYPGENTSTEWCEPVEDEEYSKL